MTETERQRDRETERKKNRETEREQRTDIQKLKDLSETTFYAHF